MSSEFVGATLVVARGAAYAERRAGTRPAPTNPFPLEYRYDPEGFDWLMDRRAGDLGRGARAAADRKAKAMQVDDRGHQAQAEAEALGAPALVRAIETLGHHAALVLRDAGAGVAHPDDGLARTAQQRELHT